MDIFWNYQHLEILLIPLKMLVVASHNMHLVSFENHLMIQKNSVGNPLPVLPCH